MIDFEKIAELWRKLPIEAGDTIAGQIPWELVDAIALQNKCKEIQEQMDLLLLHITEKMESNWPYENLVDAGYFGQESGNLHAELFRIHHKK